MDPNTDRTTMFTFSDYLHVYKGAVYFSMVYDWQFVNLEQAYKLATTHVYKPPAVLDNHFKWLMEDVSSWELISGSGGVDFEKLEISPHYWNKVLALWLTKSGKQYKEIWKWDTGRVSKGTKYILIFEIYMTDKTLFDKTSVSVHNENWMWCYLSSVYSGKYVHEYHGTHMLYYHRIVATFTNSNQRGSAGPYKLRVEMTIDNVPDSYPSTLWDSVYFVAYGYPRDWTTETDTNTVRDVYDGHPLIPKLVVPQPQLLQVPPRLFLILKINNKVRKNPPSSPPYKATMLFDPRLCIVM